MGMKYRLIESPPLSGAENMAIDEALFQCMENETRFPVLRLYTWISPTLSLGYSQNFSAKMWDSFKQNTQLHLARRITGGGAVLHNKELTYSFIAPKNKPLFGNNPKETFSLINQALLASLVYLGIEAKTRSDITSTPKGINFLCFQNHSQTDIIVNEKKLIGSAQARNRSAFLQHGSIQLSSSTLPSCHFLKENESSTNLSEIIENIPSLSQIKSAIIKGFEATFNCNFLPSSLITNENKLFLHLLSQKHLNPSWLFKNL